jgi:hypothetical protein
MNPKTSLSNPTVLHSRSTVLTDTLARTVDHKITRINDLPPLALRRICNVTGKPVITTEYIRRTVTFVEIQRLLGRAFVLQHCLETGNGAGLDQFVL